MKQFWLVLGFDRVTELEAEAVELPELSDDDVRQLLDLSTSEDLIGVFDIPDSALWRIEALSGRQLRRDLDYQMYAVEE
jgi:hypothetical protein